MHMGAIPARTLPGRLLRLPLRLVPPNAVVPILQGRFRGMRWVVGSSFPGCWLGSYEYPKRVLFERTLTPGSVVFDIGAHVGYFTLLSSVLVGPRGRVYAFEPLPRNLRYLHGHLRLNGLTNVVVIEAAVADMPGSALLDQGPKEARGTFARLTTVGPLRGSLAGSGGPITIRTIALDEEVSQGRLPPPDYLKIDVERGEMLVLSGARTLLREAHPTIVLSTHGPDVHEQCCAFLRSLGYELMPLGGEDVRKVYEIVAVYRRAEDRR